MNTYRIITDSSCDMTQEMADALELEIVPLYVHYRGKEYPNYLDGRALDTAEFYQGLRSGEMTSTAAVNPAQWKEVARPVLDAGQDVLILAFSSGLSTTFNAAFMAAQELLEEYPQRKIYVVDTLCASLGQGLLCYHVAKRRQEGATIEEARDYAEANKLHLCHWFTVDDLMFLKRGGRISGATAVMGSLLQIKPVMHVDNDGHLVPVSKARGRKASIQAMAAKVGETAFDPAKQTMFISHGDCLQDAEYLAELLKQQYHVPEVAINYVGPVIGSHSGPGTLALFFLGDHR
ncbi:MAG TPA: DegV family protein [Candidatus Avoscillospira avicola]|uniref:DegV family protein n=1 Tax=Candidatus Avoscillospira avicola TaxID=2840706 RepID=A0A9D1IWR3_9FIRM|nr:DegV family protein [Candidatus Avoscillospira avicola]